MIQRKKKNLNWFAARFSQKERNGTFHSRSLINSRALDEKVQICTRFSHWLVFILCDILIYWLKSSVDCCKLRGGSAWWSNEKIFWRKLGKISTFLRATTNTVAAASLLSVWLMIKCARQCLVDINASRDYKSEKLFLFRAIVDNIGKLAYKNWAREWLFLRCCSAWKSAKHYTSTLWP